MSSLKNRVKAFVKLGSFLDQFSSKNTKRREGVINNDLFFDAFKHQLKLAQEHNGWFTDSNIQFAIKGWSELLTEEKFNDWLKPYEFNEDQVSRKVALITAGNIPLVGFHDFLCVLLAGHSVIVKQSSNDKHLLPMLSKYLEYAEPEFKGKISFTEDKLEGFDAVIATGSNNTARYFEYYFGKKPHIIRRNRNSVAVLDGTESKAQLEALGEDVFRYYGLGCRNVSKLFVPENYNFDAFFKAMYKQKSIIDSAKYANNYDYNKAVYLMSQFELLENGFLMLKEDEQFASPIATLFYETYKDVESLRKRLEDEKENIQCVVADGFSRKEVDFGQTQLPQLYDYADDVDTIEFLLKI
ncbi:acyl-CoA reductase [Leptobacterium flavescens]|uniref:Acyl-CoA reductase n=1 Tax=Leptobacterium flavescens TaxID=472055 RepID=A0A6P0UPB8_9FLAO|nr:acyl-CoA reductase [Leptobacterium flavescens]NER13798.1 acyl-CoA reductase [Leptobacterium flavescens]